MKFKEIKDILITNAKEHNPCKSQYEIAINSTNYNELLKVIHTNFDWLLRHKLVDKSYLKLFPLKVRKEIGINVSKNQIHYNDSNNGYEIWYDTNGNCIHSKYSNGNEIWYEYDTNGNCIHSKYSNGYEIWCEYDTNGKCIHSKDSNGNERWYDTNGNCIHYKDRDGYEICYDTNGNLIPKP